MRDRHIAPPTGHQQGDTAMTSRFEKEIEELLRRLDVEAPPGQAPPDGPDEKRGWIERLQRLMERRWGPVTTEQLAALLLAFALFSYISRFALPAIGRYVSIVCLLIVVALIAYAVATGIRRR